uniref:Signal peptide peptidase-like 2B n=1 Tax=Crassostrea virginica TaxID=6565 RepID=A0A8B8BY49_CRAVI|nr:signal peptide peptidase-like 2B [Crassostrea virginica]
MKGIFPAGVGCFSVISVYVVIAMFCLAGVLGLVPANRIPFLRQQLFWRDILLVLLCLGVGVFWGVQRNESYAWVIQDILGAAFCVNMSKTVRMPNLKICVILMVLLFFYDIFFVFITPYFTSIPMVFKVPRLGGSPLNVCSLPYSLLGFGDIVIPGLLISYNHRFDVRTGGKRVYFIATVIAYGLGLIVTFCALYLMEMGQPALLYLVPFTLVTTFVIGCIRGTLPRKKKMQSVKKQARQGCQLEQPSQMTRRATVALPVQGVRADF